MEKFFELKSSEQNLLVGNYGGILQYDSGKSSENILFVIIPLTIPVTNASRNDVSPIATLGGGYWIGNVNGAQFTSSQYNAKTGQLKMYGNAGAYGAQQSYFEGYTDGEVLRGRIYTNFNARVGIIEARREK